MTTVGPAADPRVRDLLRQSAEWRLLGLLFECPAPAWRDEVEMLAREVDDPVLRGAAGLALAEATEGTYHSVFGPGGPAPPREVSYRDALELGSLMSAIAADYAAFGYDPVTREAPDHVAVEAGFVAYLRLKEAWAAVNGDEANAAMAARAAARFAADHLGAIAAPLAGLLADSGVGYLAEASSHLASRVAAQAR